MNKINTIIVDDEATAIRVVEFFCLKTPNINLLKTFQNPLEAFKFFESNEVDLIFLDVQMPDLNGIEFLKKVNGRAKVIMTSAEDPDKLIDFDINSVVAYLIKPIRYDDFIKATKLLGVPLL